MSDRRTRRAAPRRLIVLLLVGLVAVAGAAVFRSSRWAREYRLKRAPLASLRLQAQASPNDPLVFFHLAAKAYNAQSLGEAGYCFQQAIKLDPKMARAHQGLAIVQRDAGKWPEAYASAREAQRLDPKDLNTQFLIAMLVMRASESRAIPEFRKVVEKSPGWAEAWYHLGVCQEQFNQKGEALTSLRKAVTLEPKSAVYHRDLGKVLLETNFYAEAKATLETSRKLDPRDPQTAYLLAESQIGLAKSDADFLAADALLTEAQALVGPPTSENATVLAQLSGSRGSVATRLRDYEKALAHLQTARKLAPRNLTYLYDEASAHRMLGNLQRAKELTALYHRRSVQENAASQMTQRIKQDPKDPILRLKLARIYAEAGDRDRAINQYEYCLYLDPKQPDATRELERFKKQHPAPATPPAPNRPKTEGAASSSGSP